MPGQPLNLDLPSLADPFAEILAKLLIALAAIEDDLEGLIVPSEININASLSLEGNALTDAGSLQLLAGNVPTAAGAIWYADGEFYMRDASGVIQITSNGSLNVASIGTIVGDYGGVNPARVSYDNASGEYRFTEETGVWADLVADDLILNSATGSVRFGVDDAITTARQFIIKDLPASGVSCLVYDASTSTVESSENQRITNDLLCTRIDVLEEKHGDRTWTFVPAPFANVGATTMVLTIASDMLTYRLSSTGTTLISLQKVRKGDRIKSLRFTGAIVLTDPTVAVVSQVAGAATVSTTTGSGAMGAVGGRTYTLDTPLVLTDVGQTVYLKLTAPSGAVDFQTCELTYDRGQV